MLFKVSVNVVVVRHALFAGGFKDVFEVFNIQECEVSSIYA